MYYDDTDARIDEYIISKHEKEMEQKEMLTVNYKTSDNDDNVNNNKTNEVTEMANNKKVAVVFIGKNGRMSKPMMAVEDVAEALNMDWRDLYTKEDHPKALQKRGLRIARGKTLKNPAHVEELGLASGKLQPLAAYKVMLNKVRKLDKLYTKRAVETFVGATIKYYDEAKKRPITYAEVIAKTKVQDAKTIIEVVDKPVVADTPVSLFSQEVTTPLEIKVDLNNKVHPGFRPSDGYTYEEMLEKLEQERQEGIKRLIDDLNAFDWDDGLLETQQDNKEKALEAVRKAKQEIEAAEKLLEDN